MRDDAELLRRNADACDENAFRELVERHFGLVYSTALRLVAGDTHLAEDVAQSVFTDLARKARAVLPLLLEERAVLSGRLHTGVRFRMPSGPSAWFVAKPGNGASIRHSTVS